MCTVIRTSKEGKVCPVRRRALGAMPAIEDRASLVALIYALIPLELQTVGDVLEAEVTDLAGERDSRTGGHPGYVRWCQQRGVDLIFESARLVFSRWQVQCKNTGRVSLDDVAKEVGLTHFLKSNVIVVVTTGEIGAEARRCPRTACEAPGERSDEEKPRGRRCKNVRRSDTALSGGGRARSCGGMPAIPAGTAGREALARSSPLASRHNPY